MHRRSALLGLVLAACGSPETSPPPPEADLPLGEMSDEDWKADDWSNATKCKEIPNLPRLVAPRITVSINGLTVHVVDPASGYDKVFPIGPGAIVTDETKSAYQESHTYEPILFTGRQDFTIRAASVVPCKIWWTDPDTGERLPVFAGLPFMPFYGGYALHGPITGYTAQNGGRLVRGFVSHGCVRMESADILEIYARTKGLDVPVHVQREPERTPGGARVEVTRFVGSECQRDADCSFTGGFCHANAVGGRGFCTKACASTCPDLYGYPGTACVPDPNGAGGICAPRVAPAIHECRPFDHLVARTVARFGWPGQSVLACVPGSPGWVGDRCLAASDCQSGTTCESGRCTEACERFCPDLPGHPWTFCAEGGRCLRQCTPASNASECSAGDECESRARQGQPGARDDVCVH